MALKGGRRRHVFCLRFHRRCVSPSESLIREWAKTERPGAGCLRRIKATKEHEAVLFLCSVCVKVSFATTECLRAWTDSWCWRYLLDLFSAANIHSCICVHKPGLLFLSSQKYKREAEMASVSGWCVNSASECSVSPSGHDWPPFGSHLPPILWNSIDGEISVHCSLTIKVETE